MRAMITAHLSCCMIQNIELHCYHDIQFLANQQAFNPTIVYNWYQSHKMIDEKHLLLFELLYNLTYLSCTIAGNRCFQVNTTQIRNSTKSEILSTSTLRIEIRKQKSNQIYSKFHKNTCFFLHKVTILLIHKYRILMRISSQ